MFLLPDRVLSWMVVWITPAAERYSALWARQGRAARRQFDHLSPHPEEREARLEGCRPVHGNPAKRSGLDPSRGPLRGLLRMRREVSDARKPSMKSRDGGGMRTLASRPVARSAIAKGFNAPAAAS